MCGACMAGRSVPLLLRSKTLPEIEEREKKLTQEFLATQEITAKTEDHKTELEVLLLSPFGVALCYCLVYNVPSTQTRVEGFNAMCDMLEDHFEQSRAKYGSSSLPRAVRRYLFLRVNYVVHSYSFKKKREEIPLEDNSLHLNTIIEAIMTGKGTALRQSQ